jgi:MFS family permease
MMVVAVLAGTANIVLQTLAPRYVASELGVDPADAVYVFAPSAAGLALALAAAPRLIRRHGERLVAIVGFTVVATSLVTLGFVSDAGRLIDPVNPIRLLSLVGIDLGERLRTAGFIAACVGFGLSLTTTSVQTYINRRVPISYQGRAFALQSTLKNGAAIVPLLTLGALAGVLGVQTVLVFSPIVLLVVAVGLVELSIALGGQAPASRLDVLSTFWEESDEPVRVPQDEAPPPVPPPAPPPAPSPAG